MSSPGPGSVPSWGPVPDDAGDVVAIGGDLSVPTLLAAYRGGCFPWPVGGLGATLLLRARHLGGLQDGRIRNRGHPGWALPWFSPALRAVLLPGEMHVQRSLRTRLLSSGWRTTLDRDFPAVLAGCADRPGAWITPAMAGAYTELHRAGAAHSVEVWSADGDLVGGLYGVSVGRVFSGESMFHRASDASKAALLDLADRFLRAGGVLIDCQSPTEHLSRVGQRLVPRSAFLGLLAAVRDDPIVLGDLELPVARLAVR